MNEYPVLYVAVALGVLAAFVLLAPRGPTAARRALPSPGGVSEGNDSGSVALLVGVGVALGCAVGLVASQYFPIFGGFEKLGEPWSPARKSLIGIHVLGLGATGAGLAVLSVWIRNQGKASR